MFVPDYKRHLENLKANYNFFSNEKLNSIFDKANNTSKVDFKFGGILYERVFDASFSVLEKDKEYRLESYILTENKDNIRDLRIFRDQNLHLGFADYAVSLQDFYDTLSRFKTIAVSNTLILFSPKRRVELHEKEDKSGISTYSVEFQEDLELGDETNNFAKILNLGQYRSL